MNDHEMDRLLQRSDPAGRLQPLTPGQVQQLTDRARAAALGAPPAPRRAARLGGRRGGLLAGSVTGLVGSGIAAAIAVPLLLAPASGVTALRVTPSAGGLETACAPVSAEALRDVDLAVRGEVTSIEDGVATLKVLQRYTGTSADTVTVPQGTDAAVDGAGPAFSNGRDYLLAAKDDTVLACGRSGADSPSLRAIYNHAFRR